MAKFKRRNTKQHGFKIGDLVLAKMKGHKAWPAKVIDVPQRGNIKVKFYQTDEISEGPVDLTPWNASIRPPKTKDENLLGAYDRCHEEFQGTNQSSKQESQEVAPKTEKRARRVKLGKTEAKLELSVEVEIEPGSRTRIKSKTKCEVKLEVEPQPEPEPELKHESEHELEPEPEQEPQHEPEIESESTSSPEADVTEPKLPDRARSPSPIKFKANDKHTRKMNANTVDCSLNDLTSERANADRGIKRTLPKSSLTHENLETRTIEKLKKKLQRKLDEKEIKKRNRIEKKIFDKASNIWQRKFIPKFLTLSQMCEQFVAKPGDQRNANQLVTSMKNCVDGKNLDLLNKCVEPLSSHYGRLQEESKGYHQAIERMVSCVKKVKGTNLKPTSKEAKHLLGQLRANPNIKQFINSFKEWTSEQTKEEFIVERKENAQKRRKLTC